MSTLTSMNHRARWIGLFLCLLAGGGNAIAAAANCAVSVHGLAFGTYDPLANQPNDSVGEIMVACVGNAGDSVSINILLGPGNGGSFSPRTLSSGSSRLAYNVFIDAARTEIWGNGSMGYGYLSDGYALDTGSLPRNYPVYGRIPGGQNVSSGAYVDAIQVTINYL